MSRKNRNSRRTGYARPSIVQANAASATDSCIVKAYNRSGGKGTVDPRLLVVQD